MILIDQEGVLIAGFQERLTGVQIDRGEELLFEVNTHHFLKRFQATAAGLRL
jgi:hypothetical protein